jgi:hypothetical protein
MFTTTVVAVALGFATIEQDGSVRATGDNYTALVGHVAETIDRQGTRHLRGFNRVNGGAYEVTIDKGGNVEATIGEQFITFHVRQA